MTRSFIAFSCTHFPLQDNRAISWLIDTISNEQPDVVVHMGDGHEADSASRWPSVYSWTLEDEYELHNGFLGQIRIAAPNARKVFLPGNHEANITGIGRLNPKLHSLLQYTKHEPEMAHWEQPTIYEYSRRGVFRLGQVTIGHGWEHGVSANEMQAINLGLPYGLSIFGHTHAPHAVTQAMRTKSVPLPYWYANPGCLRDIDDVAYMDRNRRHLWGHGLVIGEYSDWRYDTSMMPQQPEWSAETRTIRMFNEGKK